MYLPGIAVRGRRIFPSVGHIYGSCSTKKSGAAGPDTVGASPVVHYEKHLLATVPIAVIPLADHHIVRQCLALLDGVAREFLSSVGRLPGAVAGTRQPADGHGSGA